MSRHDRAFFLFSFFPLIRFRFLCSKRAALSSVLIFFPPLSFSWHCSKEIDPSFFSLSFPSLFNPNEAAQGHQRDVLSASQPHKGHRARASGSAARGKAQRLSLPFAHAQCSVSLCSRSRGRCCSWPQPLRSALTHRHCSHWWWRRSGLSSSRRGTPRPESGLPSTGPSLGRRRRQISRRIQRDVEAVPGRPAQILGGTRRAGLLLAQEVGRRVHEVSEIEGGEKME